MREQSLSRTSSGSSWNSLSSSDNNNVTRLGNLIESGAAPGTFVDAAASVVATTSASPVSFDDAASVVAATTSPVSFVEMEINSDVSASPDTDLMLQMSCVQCRVVVWIGPVSSAPAGMSVAYPREFDWESACDHFQPHCKTCWAIEESQLNVLSNDHCAKGPVKKKVTPRRRLAPRKRSRRSWWMMKCPNPKRTT